MFEHLQIDDRRERWVVGLADAALAAGAAMFRPFRRPSRIVVPPRRILLLRLERIGDLLMSWPAIAAVRRLAPDARIDLVVGSWNEPIARLLNDVDRVETLDARWLSRGARAPGLLGLMRRARRWRCQRYDWAINFEGDIRSHWLLACSGAPRRIGFDMAGGGPLLTDRVPYDPSSHVADNLMRLVGRAFGAATEDAVSRAADRRLPIPAAARERADRLLAQLDPAHSSALGPSDLRPSTGSGRRELVERRTFGPSHRDAPLIGIQLSGGRTVKQWDPARFGDLAARLAVEHGARLVFTGAEDDRALVELAMARLPAGARAIEVCGNADLLTLAALLERVSLFVTCDTGPMHLAAAVGTPLVAIFGPSDPRRWGPLTGNVRIVQSDVDCAPCNRIRRPPARCTRDMPDCLAAIGVDRVLEAVEQMLAGTGATGRTAAEASDARR